MLTGSVFWEKLQLYRGDVRVISVMPLRTRRGRQKVGTAGLSVISLSRIK